MPIKAVGYKAIIRPEKVEEKSKGGIVLAVDERMEQRAQVLGTILDLGEDFAVAYRPKTAFWGLKPGDKVYYAKYAGKWVKDPESEEELLIINDEDICAVLKEGQPDAGNVMASV